MSNTMRSEIDPNHQTIAFEAKLPAELPRCILVAPYGEVASSNGSFVLDADAMAETIAAFREHGADLPIDFEHQTLGGPYSAPSGLAPAAGWIKSLRAIMPNDVAPRPINVAITEPDCPQPGRAGETSDNAGPRSDAAAPSPSFDTAGLWAEVEWTPLAAEHLATRQYRYLSPVALVRRSDRRMVGLHSCALTNKPAIVGMRPVVARTTPAESPAGRETLSSNENETDDAAARLRSVLALDAQVGADFVLLAAAQRIEALQQLVNARAANDRVEHAAAEGKLAPGQRDWAVSLALRDPAAFDAWLASAPRLVPLGRTAPPTNEPAESLRAHVERRARQEFRANADLLAQLCSEEAFIADALRQQPA